MYMWPLIVALRNLSLGRAMYIPWFLWFLVVYLKFATSLRRSALIYEISSQALLCFLPTFLPTFFQLFSQISKARTQIRYAADYPEHISSSSTQRRGDDR
jgi:hypothetical protein